jgi:small subunit ribosomal protein S15
MEKQKKREIVDRFKVHDEDTGSPEVQIALLTERVKELTDHLKRNRKDSTSRRALLKMVGQRASLLRYLRRENEDRYNTIISELGLRR